MSEKHDDTTIITTERQVGSGPGWFFVGAFIVIALVLGYAYLGERADDDINVSVDLPKVEMPATQ